MSILYKANDCFLLDHRDYISSLFRKVAAKDRFLNLNLTPNIFSIKSSEKEHRHSSPRRKRKRSCNHLDETLKVKQLYEDFVNHIPTDIKTEIKGKYNLLETGEVRGLSKTLFETTVFDFDRTSGGNNSEEPLQCDVKDHCFLIPPKSRFFCGCVKEQCHRLDSKFDLVIADPPWWNKFIRRLKGANDKLGYKMMYNEDIASIPVAKLLSPNCIIAMWCTNSPSNITSVKDQIFPSWGVEYLTTWYWMKVTIDLEPLCSFGSGYKKQPFERLVLGKVGEVSVPNDQLFVSVPSALHSHKPPLLDILSPHIKASNPQVLELFARYLLPNTTSIGFEPLKWQHMSLYEQSEHVS